MLTPATYKILDHFFYVPGDNTPHPAALKLKDMLNIYNAIPDDSYADSFLIAERRKACFRNSHEQDNDTAYRYTLEQTPDGLILIAEIVKRRGWRKKTTTRPFFKGSVEEFIRYYSSSPSFATAIYKIHDESLQDALWFYAYRGSDPREAAFRLGVMNGLHRSDFMTYAAAFVRANKDVEFHPHNPSHQSFSDYLYILEPSEDDEEREEFTLKAYAAGNNHRLFFEGCLEEFIQIFGKN